MNAFVAGTRGSALALWQTRKVIALLEHRTKGNPPITERIITTQGDTSLADRLVGQLEKGFFTQELEAALHDRSIQLAVHSLKDLPTRQPPGLCLGAVLERASPFDLLLVRPEAMKFSSASPLPIAAGAKIGSSSLRRAAQLERFAPGTVSAPLRGNVPTRVEKLRSGQYDGILLAAAGVQRLELSMEGLAVFRLDPRLWTPAPGQGAVAVQCREDDADARALLGLIHHAETARAVSIERDLLRVFEGGCSTPFGCYVEGDTVWVGLQAHGRWRAAKWEVPAPDTKPDWEQQLAALSSPDYVEKMDAIEPLCSRL
jgi:hydroxymethylbilane synthase